MYYNSVGNYPINQQPLAVEDLTGGKAYLTPAVYNLNYNSFKKGFELSKTYDRFKLPEKIYGKSPAYARHFLTAYSKGSNNLGVILTGTKGTGKTELSKLLCNMGIDAGIPVVTMYDINNREVNKLIEFVENLGTVIMFMDEFGKNFPYGTQERMLPLLSSSSNGKKLFIITENNVSYLSNYIVGRPGRARYHIDFKRLDEDTVDEYLNDFPIEKKFKQELLAFYKRSKTFTFDYLRALVEEHLLFPNTDFKDLVKIMNMPELKEESFLVITSVEINDEETGNKIPVKYTQVTVPTYDSFNVGKNIDINILKEDARNPGASIFDTAISLGSDDISNIEGTVYHFTKSLYKNDKIVKYDVVAEIADKNKKTELISQGVISPMNINNNNKNNRSFF